MAEKSDKKCNTCGRVFRSEQDYLTGTNRWRLCEAGNLWFNCQCNSTMMIIKGRFPWYAPDAKLSEDAKSLFNSLPQINELPHIPTSVMEMQLLIQEENTTSTQLAKVCKRDPLIASNIMKIANTLKRNNFNKIDSLEHAITYVGFESLADILLTASIASFEFPTQEFNSKDFWDRSYLCGQIAELIVRTYSPHLIADEAYLAGALCNVGKVIQAVISPQKTDAIALSCSKGSNWLQGEVKFGAPTHTILGEIAGSFWGLPEFVLSPIGNHHQSQICGSQESPGLEHVVQLANQITHWAMLEPTQIDSLVLNNSALAFGLNPRSLEQFVDSIMAKYVA